MPLLVPYLGCMSRRKISNEVWVMLEPLIPAFMLSPKGGRRCSASDREALNGILCILQAGLPWEHLPGARNPYVA
ncbi:transposase [Paraburkholderia bonniea]|uniref:transposase n=1 Tax=Paraburkholderia bonniea TaxID=2152891 RepID=UPI0012911F9D